MIRNLPAAFLFFWMLPVFVQAQISFDVLQFGDTVSNNRGSVSISDAEGNIFFAGTISNGTDNSDDIALYKFSPDGDILWNFTYGDSASEFVNNMIRLNDRYFIICGDITNPDGNMDGFIMKADTAGNAEWIKPYGIDSLNEDIYGITLLENGNIAATGFHSALTGTGNDFLVVLFTPDGEIIRDTVFGADVNDYGMGIAETTDHDLIISGDRATADGFYNPVIVRMDTTCNIVWDQFIDLPVNSGCKTVHRKNDGRFILCGEAATPLSPQFDMFISVFDADGVIAFAHNIPGEGVEAAYDITEVYDEQYYLTGFGYNPATGENDLLIVYADSTGNEIERKYFGGAGADFGYDIHADTAGNFLVSGFTTSGDNVLFMLIYDHFEKPLFVEEDLSAGNNCLLYPDPVYDILHIETGEHVLSVALFDISGRCIAGELKRIAPAAFSIPENITPGMYLLRIATENSVLYKKIKAG